MAGVIRREVHRHGARLDHADRAGVGEVDEGVDGPRDPPRPGRHDERRLGRGQDLRGFLDAGRVREPPARHLAPRGRLDGHLLEPLRQDLTRQHQVDRAARLGHRQLQGTVHDRLQVHRLAELVVPLHELAEHPGLVEGLLRPVDVGVPRPLEAAVLGDGAPARGEDDRRLGPRRVDDGAHPVRGADGHVDHDDLRSPRHGVVAVSHRDRDELVRDEDRPRRRLALRREPGEGVDDRSEVGSGVPEEALDPALAQDLEVRLGDRLDAQRLGRHQSSMR